MEQGLQRRGCLRQTLEAVRFIRLSETHTWKTHTPRRKWGQEERTLNACRGGRDYAMLADFTHRRSLIEPLLYAAPCGGPASKKYYFIQAAME